MPYIVTTQRAWSETEPIGDGTITHHCTEQSRCAVRSPEDAAEYIRRMTGHTAFVPDAGGTFFFPDGTVTVTRQTWRRLEALAGMRDGDHDPDDTDAILDAYNAAQEA